MMSKKRSFKRVFRRPEVLARIEGETGDVGRFLATVLELAADGVIRAGKKFYSDLTAGFWLGIDSQ